MLSIIALVFLLACCGLFLARAAAPLEAAGLGRLGAKDRMGLVAAGVGTVATLLIFRAFLPATTVNIVGWGVVGLVLAAGVTFGALRWPHLPVRRTRRDHRTGAERPRSWLLAGASLTVSAIALIAGLLVIGAPLLG